MNNQSELLLQNMIYSCENLHLQYKGRYELFKLFFGGSLISLGAFPIIFGAYCLLDQPNIWGGFLNAIKFLMFLLVATTICYLSLLPLRKKLNEIKSLLESAGYRLCVNDAIGFKDKKPRIFSKHEMQSDYHVFEPKKKINFRAYERLFYL